MTKINSITKLAMVPILIAGLNGCATVKCPAYISPPEYKNLNRRETTYNLSIDNYIETPKNYVTSKDSEKLKRKNTRMRGRH